MSKYDVEEVLMKHAPFPYYYTITTPHALYYRTLC